MTPTTWTAEDGFVGPDHPRAHFALVRHAGLREQTHAQVAPGSAAPKPPTTEPVVRLHDDRGPTMAVIGDVRALGAELERSYPVYVRGRLKFRVGQLVYVAFSFDETVMGFAFPKEERPALVASDPRKFQMPSASDLRFNWVHADLASLEPGEARELVVDAWRMVVPKKLSRAYDLAHPNGPG